MSSSAAGPRRRGARAGVAVVLAASVLPAAVRSAGAQQVDAPRTRAYCAPVALTGSRFDSVRVVAAVVPFDSTYQYAWTAPDGTVQGTGPVVWWSLAGVATGPDSITVRVTRNGASVASCTARLAVVSPIAGDSARGERDLAARALLLPGESEAPGSARYSYILFAARPTDQARALYRAVLREYVRQFPTVANYASALGADSTKVKLFHAVYVPTRQAVPDTVGDSLAVERLLQQYDYARARVLLSRLPGQHPGGVYVVTVPHPLTAPTAGATGYVQQDFTGKPVEVVADCLALFFSDAVQDRPASAWDPQTLGVRLDTMFAVLAQAVKPVAEGIRYWQNVFKGATVAK